ncbi:uroporphyrinogen-III synthase [uncultured Sulfitobacter sp.]|uniref:uroporphyrinogen-III synthase n=1 Tax=uncultured Sulfitobacter sp. TaxID=191468 RepID=UPI002614169F|nr:uroporphyrinogen-III synthase [uncultured Sulfitobacter sp.]
MPKPTLLLTRPRAQSEQFLADLARTVMVKVNVDIAPLMEIESTQTRPRLDPSDTAVFTSLNGVRHAPDGLGRRAYCVGAGTTAAATGRGWDAVQSGQTADALVSDLLTRRPDGTFVHLAGAHTRGSIVERLIEGGLSARRLTIYRQIMLPLADTARAALRTTCIVPLFSPRSARHFAGEAGNHIPAVHVIALSEAVAAPLKLMTVASLTVLDAPEIGLMRKAVENQCLIRALS